jgi:hypothetical protein
MGYVGATRCKPLRLFDPQLVPRRVSENHIEAAGRLGTLPSIPDSREGNLPVQWPLALGDGAHAAEQSLETCVYCGAGLTQAKQHSLSCGVLREEPRFLDACWRNWILSARGYRNRWAKGSVDQRLNRGTIRRLKVQPTYTVPEAKKASQRRCGVVNGSVGRRGSFRLRDVGIGRFFDLGHAGSRGSRLHDVAIDVEGAALGQLLLDRIDELSKQAIATLEVVIEKGKWCSSREGVQPQQGRVARLVEIG